MKLILFTCIFAILLSCGKASKLKKELTQLSSKSIVIPKDMQVVYNNKDTLIADYFDNAEMKLIVYTDSASCGSCYVKKLYLWQPIIEYAAMFKGKLKLYFIFQPPKDQYMSLKSSIANSSMNYPIAIDRQGAFEHLNTHIPTNKDMHTFLLDKNNKVILVGSPLYNKNIEKLFYQRTQSLLNIKD